MRLDKYLEVKQNGPVKKIAVAAAEDADVLVSVNEALRLGLADAILVGDEKKIRKIIQEESLALDQCRIVDAADHKEAAETAVALIRSGEAQVLMKGCLHSTYLMHAILDKEKGIRGGGVLNTLGIIDSPMLDRLIILTDGGMIPYPTFQQKIEIINNTVRIAKGLGIETPKVAAICAVEVVNPAMPPTMEAAALAVMSQRGQFKDCIVDGPLALDNAVSAVAAIHKGVKSTSPVVGHADIVLVPNIETGNAVMKALRYMGGCSTAGLLAGAQVPVVMTSRADSAENKLRSIACALAAAENNI